MSYFKLNAGMPNANKSIGNLTAPASISADQRLPCSSISHTGLTVNASGQLELSANTTFLLFGSPLVEDNASPYSGSFSCQWYDVTNSNWIGRPLITWAGISASTSFMKSSIARAVIYPTASTTVELRIKTVASQIDKVNAATPSAHWPSSHAPYIGTQFYTVLSF